MEKEDVEKIEKIIRDRVYSHNYLLNQQSKAYKSFLDFEKNAFSTNRLDRKYKELIAIGISIVNNCESCMEWHIHQALEFGATFDELFETLDVGIEMGGGPATVSVRFAIKVIEYYRNQMIRQIQSENDLIDCSELIRKSFKTVANDMNLTPENAPSHPSNLTLDSLKNAVDNGIMFFGLFQTRTLAGCVGIEKSVTEDGTFYLEKLCVSPEYRHGGFGKMLLDFAFQQVRDRSGKKVSIGIINEHTVLKNWYHNYGFREVGIKRFEHLPFEVCFMEKKT